MKLLFHALLLSFLVAMPWLVRVGTKAWKETTTPQAVAEQPKQAVPRPVKEEAPATPRVSVKAKEEVSPKSMTKVAVINEPLDFAAELENGIVVIVSHHRLSTCRRGNIGAVLDTYWRPTRTSSIPAVYRNCLYLCSQSEGDLEVFHIAEDGTIGRTAVLRKGGTHRVPVIRDGKLYDVGREDGAWQPVLFVYSLTDPSSPSLLQQVSLLEMKTIASSFQLVGDVLLCVSQGRLWAFELDPEGEAKVSGSVAFETGNIVVGGLAVADGRAYLYTGCKISTFDISRPEEMKEVSAQPFPYGYTAFGGSQGFLSIGNDEVSEYVYPDDRDKGVVARPPVDAPDTWFVPGLDGGYLVGREGSLTERPFGEPRPRNRCFGSRRDYAASGVAADGHLYVSQLGNLEVFALDDPSNPRLVGQLGRIPSSASRFHLRYHGGRLYTDHQMIDVTDPTAPKVKAEFPASSSVSIRGSLMCRLQGKEYVVARLHGGKPPETLFTGTFAGEDEPRHILAAGKHVYVAFDRKRIGCFEVGEGYSLVPVSRFELPDDAYTMDMAANGNWLYVAMNGAGTAVFDVSDPGNPKLARRLDTSQFSEQVLLSGNTILTAEGSGGVLAMDLLHEGGPVLLSGHGTCDWTCGIAAYRGYVYALEGHAGIAVFRCPDLAPDEPAEAAATPVLSLSGETRSAVDGLVRALGASSFREREGAQTRLWSMLPDEDIRQHLVERLAQERDPEICERLRQLVK